MLYGDGLAYVGIIAVPAIKMDRVLKHGYRKICGEHCRLL